MPKDIATIVSIAVIGANLVVVGIVGMLIASQVKNRRLDPFLKNKELSSEWLASSSLVHSLREVGLGLIITLVVPIFTRYCIVGSASDAVSILVGYLAGGLCALGCYSRQWHNLNDLGIVSEKKSLTHSLVVFACFLAVFLWGVLSLSLAFFSFKQQH